MCANFFPFLYHSQILFLSSLIPLAAFLNSSRLRHIIGSPSLLFGYSLFSPVINMASITSTATSSPRYSNSSMSSVFVRNPFWLKSIRLKRYSSSYSFSYWILSCYLFKKSSYDSSFYSEASFSISDIFLK